MPPAEYQAEMTRIRNGINTVPDLSRRLQDDPDNVDLLVTLATKVETMSGLKAAISYWEELFAKENASIAQHSIATLKMALFHAEQNKDPETLISFVNNETNTEVLPQAYSALRRFYQKSQDNEAEAEIYRRHVDFMSGINKIDAGFLNGYAWRMTQLDLNLENALQRVNQAVELLAEDEKARDKAQIMDTKGEVLWKLGRIEEAVVVMDACIKLQPEDKYYQEQKAKFLAPS